VSITISMKSKPYLLSFAFVLCASILCPFKPLVIAEELEKSLSQEATTLGICDFDLYGKVLKVKLLAGINAPTDGTPYPVVLKNLSPVMDSDGKEVEVDIRLIGRADGILDSSRVEITLETITFRTLSGQRVDMPIEGQIWDLNGQLGFAGELREPIGMALIGGVLLSSGAPQLQNNLAILGDSEHNNFFTEDGVPSLPSERIRDLIPVVSVLSGLEATAKLHTKLDCRNTDGSPEGV